MLFLPIYEWLFHWRIFYYKYFCGQNNNIIRAGWGISTNIYYRVTATRFESVYLASLQQGARSGNFILPGMVMLCPSGGWLSFGLCLCVCLVAEPFYVPALGRTMTMCLSSASLVSFQVSQGSCLWRGGVTEVSSGV